MKIFFTLVPTVSLIFNFIECSSHSGRNPYGESDPGAASPGREHTTERTSTAQPSSRDRSRSPTSGPPSVKVLGCSLEQLGYMRLTPYTNQHVQFEFRRYVFPAGQPIQLRTEGQKYIPVPDGEHIVLSTYDGDILAILEYSGFFRGIYKSKRLHPRVKINIISGAIDELTPDESRDCPVGKNCPIFPKRFIKSTGNSDSLKFEGHPGSEYNPGTSYSGRPPPVKILGYTIGELGYVRLIPSRNKDQRFQFRRYKFPTDKSIKMIIENVSYSFVPTREYIVVSTSNGEVFAILDYSGTLRGIYGLGRTRPRVKINMISGAIHHMTPDEVRDCQVGKNYPVFPTRFTKELSDHNSLHSSYDSTGKRNSGSSPVSLNSLHLTPSQEHHVATTSSSPPGRPPSDGVLDIPLARLGYIRLIPDMNPHRQFEFRKYVFPHHRRIYLLSGYNKYVPMPTREYIALSTSSGDVYAILEYTGILRGIYKANRTSNFAFSRIRINMMSGEIHYLTKLEIQDCHVGQTYSIFSHWFTQILSDEDSLQQVYQ